MNKLSHFSGLYPVSKTLRFELKPIGKTQENIEKNGILFTDIKRAEDYKEVKKLIDEYHKFFINKVLAGFSFSDGLLDSFESSYKSSEDSKDSDKDRLFKLTTDMRKEIATAFSKAPEFKRLFAKELILEDLPAFFRGEEGQRELVLKFDKFTTYFTGFHENRRNMYSAKKKTTAIAYRLVNENLFIFMENIQSFQKIFESPLKDKFDIIHEAFPEISEIMGDWNIKDLFLVSNYASFLVQKSINCYNAIIGGKSLEDGTKVQGINEYVNLYNQTLKEKSEHLPKLKTLKKQILSDRDSLSWLPEEFEDDQQLLESVEIYYQNLMECLDNGVPSAINALKNINSYDKNRIYIKNDSQLRTLSLSLYGDWGAIKRSIEAFYKRMNPKKKKETEDKYATRIEKLMDKAESFSLGMLESETKDLEGRGITEYFSSFGQNVFEQDFISSIRMAYEQASDLLNTDYPKENNLAQDKDNVAKIKNLLDSIKDFQHFIKLLAGDGKESDKDACFYGDMNALYEIMDKFTPLYDMVRNRMTRKPFSIEKIKLNFDNSTLLHGWDVNKEVDNSGIILRKDGLYYLLIISPKFAREFKKGIQYTEGGDSYEKMEYKLLPEPYKSLPHVFFAKSKIEKFAPSEELLKKKEEGTHKNGADFNIDDCRESIDFFKRSISKHEDWSKFNFVFSDTNSYKDLNDFYREVQNQGYRITFRDVSSSYIDEYINEGKAYLFQIYNKDFSPSSKGTPNLHTIYWKMLFNEKNLKNIVYKLNGQAEVFYRKRSINLSEPTHPAGKSIKNKNPNNAKKESVFDYDLVKDRRYTVDKYQFHVPITMNFCAEGREDINMDVKEYIHNGGIKHVIGIDRGERNLLYLSIINLDGEIVEQYSLNEIVNKNRGNIYRTDYNKILEERAGQRAEARQSWKTIETIKELKEGYISQIIHKVASLIVKYDAIVALEDLNFGFKRGRQKVEKQVYQKFEKMLIDKLNYYVDKQLRVDEPCGALNALQLASKFKSFSKLEQQSGFLFYVPAWNTSKIDPVTGFVNLFDTKYENIQKSKQFFSKFQSIKYNKEKNYFEFSFDYNDFTTKAENTKTCWTVCTYGPRILTRREESKNNQFVSSEVNLNDEFNKLFKEYNVSLDDIKNGIEEIEDKAFFERLLSLFRLTLQMRNSISGSDVDYIISPVQDKNGNFYDSRICGPTLPKDADANGAYNIARKGLWIVELLRRTDMDELQKVKLNISNKEWLIFVQGQA